MFLRLLCATHACMCVFHAVARVTDEIARVKAKEAEMLKRERGIEQQFIEEMTQGTQGE